MAEGYDPQEIEAGILRHWRKEQTYQKAKDRGKGKPQWYFLDGPPYTSGKVHIGTAWNKSLKDAILRYKRMKGLDVWDRAGYDMHGLPTENATLRKLGIETKEEVERLGVPRFIGECKRLCVENMLLMNEDFQRLGVWMDFEGAYQSISKEFMEGEWWLIRKAHENGRLYEGLRTMTWCPISESALAKHELEYRTVEDDSIFVKMLIEGTEDEYLVIWTTTPWTIPFNLAIMAGPDIDYVKVKVEGTGEKWVVASKLIGVFMGGVVDRKYEVVEEMKGTDLEGLRYVHPFYEDLRNVYDPIITASKKAFSVLLSSEYVDTSAGTGLVHCAPGCGPEDYEIGYRNGIPAFNTIDTKGVFPEEMGPFAGWTAKKDDPRFIEHLERKGALIATTRVEHEYAHDWRHHKPVIFRTTKQWFFRIEDLKEKMIAANKDISWVPESAFNAFESWLTNLRDNSISKQRYWGTPLPIWRNEDDPDDYIVVGSAAELERLSGTKVDDLHIPAVDPVIIRKGKRTYRRVPDILDVWVDAGTVSWNCLDFPHRKDLFERLFPADFILEGKDQFRGWFNLLLVASMVSMERPSFRNVYVHGFVQDAQGRKMSKSLGNYILPSEVVDTYGADAFRYYTIGGSKAGIDLNYNFDDLRIKQRNLGILWNLSRFVIDYAAQLGKNPLDLDRGLLEKDLGTEERHMLSRMHSAIRKAGDLFEQYRIDEVPAVVEDLFLELSRGYIQFVREKAQGDDGNEQELVLHTIFSVLDTALTLFAPIAPFITERIFLNLKGLFGLPGKSVHLRAWPEADVARIDRALEKEMAIAEEVIQSALNARERANLGVRWPAKELVLTTTDRGIIAAVERMRDLIKGQVNAKDITIVPSFHAVRLSVRPDYRQIGPDFGERAPRIIAKLASESAATILSHIERERKHLMRVDGEEVAIVKEHLIVERTVDDRYVESPTRHGFVYLDTLRDDELDGEGFAREIMRRTQALRKKAGLEKRDRIDLFLRLGKGLYRLVKPHEKAIAGKTGASRIQLATEDLKGDWEHASEQKVKGERFDIYLKKA
ncbi:isoleucine--tRNA ligase [Candidatus Woesearchaeota archaeon]|nr:isoleucine--tRNA ligase [Candidatus Woesearchaeota archaeon]